MTLTREVRTTIALVLLVVVATALFFLAVRFRFDVPAVASQLREAGQEWWAPLAFVGLYAGLAFLLVPLFPLSIAATLMWGWLLGGVIEWVAAVLASLGPYALSRSGSDFVRGRYQHPRLEEIDRRLAEKGFITLLVLRFVQVIPFSVLNFLAGAARMQFRHYLAATAIGLIPPIFVFTFLVDAIEAGVLNVEQAGLRVAGAGLIAALFALSARWVVRRWGLGAGG